MNVVSAKRYVIAAKVGAEGHKLFQIIASARDGSLYLAFPYYERARGVLGEVTLKPKLAFPADITIGETLYGTSHVVKYAHHASGRSHFSLTGKAAPLVKKQSVPLSEASGHVFTLKVQGISRFKPLEADRPSTPKRKVIPFAFAADNAPVALKFVGFWYSERELASRLISSNGQSPWYATQHPDGRRRMGIALATTFKSRGVPGYVFLTAEPVPQIAPGKEVSLQCLGGFDPVRLVHDHKVGSSFLLFMYPEPEGPDGIAGAMGTVDVGPDGA